MYDIFCPIFFNVRLFLSGFLSDLFECQIFLSNVFCPFYLNAWFFLRFFLSNFLSDIFQCPNFFSDFLSDIFECPIYCSIFFRFFLIYLNVRSICPIYFSIFFRFFLIYLNVRYYLSDIFVHLCCTCKVAFLLIRPIVFVFHRPRCVRRF